jgi:RNA polymerase sigma-70 factor (ECF subfamily)
MPISKKIIKQCKKQKPEAQKIIFEEYSPEIMGVCMRYVKDFDIASDIVQETFITVFSKIDQYQGNGSFEGWIRKIAVNANLMYLRANKKKLATENLEQYLENDSIVFEEESDIENDTKKELIEKAGFNSNDILRVMSKMPEGFKAVFNLYAIEGYKHREISKLLNISVGTSKSQLLRGRIKMQDLLYEEALEKLKNSL